MKHRPSRRQTTPSGATHFQRTSSETQAVSGESFTMRSFATTYLCAFVASLTISVAATGQQFTPEYFPFNTIRPAVQVDLNGDGIPDFITLTPGFQITELLSSGGGNFTPQNLSIPGSNGGYVVACGDFNGD